jgi:hypothetical protein
MHAILRPFRRAVQGPAFARLRLAARAFGGLLAGNAALDGESTGGAPAPLEEPSVSYLIAAYGIVIAALVLYGLRIQAQRRAHLRQAPHSRED